MIPSLETARLRLRPYRPEDFEVFAEMSADPDVMRYIDAPQDRATAFRSFCAGIGHWTVRGYGSWAMEEKGTGQFAGRAGLFDWEGNHGLEVGYALRRGFWGRGYASEAAERVLAYAHAIGKRGVISVIEIGNEASVRVAEKLGGFVDRKSQVKGRDVFIYRYPDPERTPRVSSSRG